MAQRRRMSRRRAWTPVSGDGSGGSGRDGGGGVQRRRSSAGRGRLAEQQPRLRLRPPPPPNGALRCVLAAASLTRSRTVGGEREREWGREAERKQIGRGPRRQSEIRTAAECSVHRRGRERATATSRPLTHYLLTYLRNSYCTAAAAAALGGQ